jgi:hypothetical protein
MYQQLARTKAKAVTTSNTDDLTYSTTSGNDGCLIYVGTATAGQTIKVLTVSGDEVTFTNPKQGEVLPVFVKRVFATGTNATNLIALW